MALRDIYISRLGEGTVNFDLVPRFRNLHALIFDRLFGSEYVQRRLGVIRIDRYLFLHGLHFTALLYRE